MRHQRLQEILDGARVKRVLIAGDLILDEFVWGDVSRISPEAPVPIVHVTGESWYPGGAANVARNVRELAVNVSILGVTGDDEHGRRLSRILEDAGVDTSGIIRDPARSTIVKTRVIAKHQQVVRVDRERPSTNPVLPEAIERLRAMPSSMDAVIVSDYAKGFLTQKLADELLRRDVRRPIVTVDPSPLNPIDWSGATAIKPNRSEALRAAGVSDTAGPQPEDLLERVGRQLLDQWRTRFILLTLGEEGMMLFERGRPPYHTPTRAREIFDVSGAGDTAIAAFTVSLVAGATPEEAAEIANEASGIVVGKLGTATVTREELLARCKESE
jgi:D-beta-D-heptose 7-phosphate kinase/D-beta-D-heptose 1-phosphate adenosyltransferase